MRYSINFDKDGYVQNIFKTGNPRKDVFDLDLSQYDFSNSRIFAYKYEDGSLVFDKNRYKDITNTKETKKNKKEVNELKEKLYETDYIVARAFEEIMLLDNPITFISDFLKIVAKYSKKYKSTISERDKWRKRIEELDNWLLRTN